MNVRVNARATARRSESQLKTGTVLVSLSMAMVAMGCHTHGPDPVRRSPETGVDSSPGVSLALVPDSSAFDLGKVPQGTVGFTASIKNEGTATVIVAHPSVCEPAGYKGKERRFSQSHGKSEILLEITKPDGSTAILRDGYSHAFDPDLHPLRTIPPNGMATFHMGWFFENQRGRWEQADLAAKMFLAKGRYRVRMLFRNVLPKARFYDEKTKEVAIIDVWTGEMESEEIAIEVKGDERKLADPSR